MGIIDDVFTGQIDTLPKQLLLYIIFILCSPLVLLSYIIGKIDGYLSRSKDK